jgi:hypothetical protein
MVGLTVQHKKTESRVLQAALEIELNLNYPN